ncbi:MAG: CoA transferase [Mycobacterium sp.]|nr:CoA transferase [Mycobacterium sp.]
MSPAPLSGVRIVEISSFVAVPLAGMTLAQLGAEVVRIDPVGGAADYRRWPVTPGGDSIYWAGLNKGKRSMEVDMRCPDGQRLVQRLIAAAGVLITNAAGRQWHSYEQLSALRADLIHLEVVGRIDGRTGVDTTAVDYTVNAATGFPLVTGPPDHVGPVNHVMPSWDVSCGLYAALAILAALRRRDADGRGSRIRLPLDDVALATAANLGFLTEVMVNGDQRPRLGNSIFGQYGRDFAGNDGESFMVVALTGRHFRALTELTGTTKAVAALAEALGVDFDDEGDRYRHRGVLDDLFAAWFARHSAAEITAALSASSVLWDRYQSFAEVANSARVTANPMFAPLEQDRVGRYLAPGLPMSVDGAHVRSAPAPALGQDNASLPAEWLGE